MNHPPRVAHLVISLEHGGLEQCALQWCLARNQRHPNSTIIICLDDIGALASHSGETPIFALKANRKQFPWDRNAVRQLKKLISENNIEIIHSHNTAARQYASLACRGYKSRSAVGGRRPENTEHEDSVEHRTSNIQHPTSNEEKDNDLITNNSAFSIATSLLPAGQPVALRAAQHSAFSPNLTHIYTDHGTNIYLNGIINRIRLEFMKRHTDGYVAVSEEAALNLATAEHISIDNISVIKNGIAITPNAKDTYSTNDLRKEWKIPNDAFVLGYIGRLSQEKGVDRLIRSFATLLMKSPKTFLIIIGDGNERKNLEKISEGLNITDKVLFLGAQTNARRLMHAFNLFVLPSRSEGLPLVLLEAMAEATCVAATNVGQCGDVLQSGKLGVLLPDDDNDWTEVILKIVDQSSSSKTAQIITAAKLHITDNYSIDNTISEYEKIYE